MEKKLFAKIDKTNPAIERLLILQVINAVPSEYLFKRGISLWVSINAVFFKMVDQHFSVVVRPLAIPTSREMAW